MAEKPESNDRFATSCEIAWEIVKKVYIPRVHIAQTEKTKSKTKEETLSQITNAFIKTEQAIFDGKLIE